METHSIFRCVSIRRSVSPLVCQSICNAFVKIAKNGIMHLRAVFAALLCSKCVVRSAFCTGDNIGSIGRNGDGGSDRGGSGDSVYNCAYFSIGTILGLKTAHF